MAQKTPLTFGQITGLHSSDSLLSRRFLAAVGDPSLPAFSGTIVLEWRHPEENIWRRAVDASGTEVDLTGNGQSIAFEFLMPVEARLTCTVYTSGPIQYSLGAQVVENLG